MQRSSPGKFPAKTYNIAVITTNQDGLVTVFNDSASELLGYMPEEIIGHAVPIVNFEELKQDDLLQAHIPLDSQLIHKSGDLLNSELFTSIIKNEAGHTTGYLFTTPLNRAGQEVNSCTELPDKKVFDIVLDRELRRTQREQDPLSLLVIDMDFYKDYLAHYGTQETEICLNHIALALSERVQRASDFLAYAGHDEFLVLLPNTDRSGTVKVAEQLRLRVASLGLHHDGSAANGIVTVSIGVANLIPDRSITAEKIEALARNALQQAKQDGRNCTRLA